MHVLITGAAGFLGQALAAHLVQNSSITSITLTDVIKPTTIENPRPNECSITSIESDLTDPSNITELCPPEQEIDIVYILHGLMSGASEANLELSLRINIDSIRNLLDRLRLNTNASKGQVPRIIFPSSLAVYGPPPTTNPTVSETTLPLPSSTYGAQKLIIETLLSDYSRRGLLDARIVRLPTVTVRPGKPTGAASSFASGIIREPLLGEKSILPVPRSMELWICSPRTVVKNLEFAGFLPAERFGPGESRIVNLPGITASVEEMLQALRRVGGEEALALVEEVRDSEVERIVGSWPARFDVSKAERLGFVRDGLLEQSLWDFIADYGRDSRKVRSGAAR